MGKAKSKEWQEQHSHDAQQTDDVRRRQKKDRCGTARPMGEGQSRKESWLSEKLV
jgi:hypothetical protein